MATVWTNLIKRAGLLWERATQTWASESSTWNDLAPTTWTNLTKS